MPHHTSNAPATAAATATATSLKLIKAGSRFLLFTMLLLLWYICVYRLFCFSHCAEGGKRAALNEQCHLCKRNRQRKIEFRFLFHGISIKAFSVWWNIIICSLECMECFFYAIELILERRNNQVGGTFCFDVGYIDVEIAANPLKNELVPFHCWSKYLVPSFLDSFQLAFIIFQHHHLRLYILFQRTHKANKILTIR